ncbi:AcrR family transcriptional regulator [Saccharothrix coeruleofusca]|uniref:TetR/AcrR family transcriptional regulator n=1 Tax=Saccharothrix coeruleofusca TaxID=33919 RepID=UPI0027DDA82A|nr:helix-turn-helix domain-containing protein [Saccharothrix coeruleofusca]MBP2336091.1 AcrR family transcriptional regulator [Saccharothrix coeruleofusca]
MVEAKPERHRTRTSIVEVAARLLRERGAQAVTTRAVAQAAGMQAPTIYRFFEDKDALLDAVAEHVFAAYVAEKAVAEDGDPVADLRAGWRVHIDFGLANAALFGLLTDPARTGRSPAATAGLEVLRARVRRVAAAGRLRVAEQRAVELLHAAGTGTVLTLLALPPQERDPGLADAMYEAVTRSILTDPPPLPPGGPAAPAALRAAAAELPMLTAAERALLSEWLDREGGTPG